LARVKNSSCDFRLACGWKGRILSSTKFFYAICSKKVSTVSRLVLPSLWRRRCCKDVALRAQRFQMSVR